MGAERGGREARQRNPRGPSFHSSVLKWFPSDITQSRNPLLLLLPSGCSKQSTVLGKTSQIPTLRSVDGF